MRYEAIPYRLMSHGIPNPEPGALPHAPSANPDESSWPAEIPIVGLRMRSMTFEEARQHGDALLRRCRHRLRQGERWALAELLDDHPGFIVVPWVRHEVLRCLRSGPPAPAARPTSGAV